MKVFPRRRKTLGHLRMPPDCAAEGSRSEPEAHEDLVDVRLEHGQLGLGESARPHPLEDSLHHASAEARFPPAVLDRDPDASDVAVLRERASVAIRGADDLAAIDRHDEDVADSIELLEPTSFGLEVRDFFHHDVYPLPPNAVHVPQTRLGILHSCGAQDDLASVAEGDLPGPQRVRHAPHKGNLSRVSGRRRSPEARYASICSLSWGVMSAYTSSKRDSIRGGGCRSTSLIVFWIRSSISARSRSSSALDHSPFSSRYLRIRSIGSFSRHRSTSSVAR